MCIVYALFSLALTLCMYRVVRICNAIVITATQTPDMLKNIHTRTHTLRLFSRAQLFCRCFFLVFFIFTNFIRRRVFFANFGRCFARFFFNDTSLLFSIYPTILCEYTHKKRERLHSDAYVHTDYKFSFAVFFLLVFFAHIFVLFLFCVCFVVCLLICIYIFFACVFFGQHVCNCAMTKMKAL